MTPFRTPRAGASRREIPSPPRGRRRTPPDAISASHRRGFSLLEMLIALAISAALLTATLAALDASFKQYKSTTESASSHVISRIVMHRMLSMVRTGVEFGPYPEDVFDDDQNPVVTDFIEFVSERDIAMGVSRITRLELRPANDESEPGELWRIVIDTNDESEATVVDERPLLRGVRDLIFTLHYNRETYLLDRATVDMTVEPSDSQDLRIGVASDPGAPQVIRLVASAAPRQNR